VRALRSSGYRLVTLGEQARLAQADRAYATASLSFDDGFADNYTTVLPLLRRIGVPATVFAVTGWLGDIHPAAPWARILTIGQLRSVHAAGIEVGGHTVTHPDLTTLSAREATAELFDCRETLQALLDAPVTLAAYPFGKADEATFEACRAAGHELRRRRSRAALKAKRPL
jgi:peptidoglycan/xylan/chitin deacetylase (PgdA/CDA1 family)